MNKTNRAVTLVLVVMLISPVLFGYCAHASAGELDEACDFAYAKLKSVRGAQVARTTGGFTYRDQQHQGCILTLTGDGTGSADGDIPHGLLYPFEGSPSHKAGWRPDIQSEADGPDGTVFRIVRGNTFCLVEGRWDGGDDSDPTYVPSDRYEVIVQCSSVKK
jgi:hypothetical protein